MAATEEALGGSIFGQVDPAPIVSELHQTGAGFGLNLDDSFCELISAYAEKNLVYAFRDPKLGFFQHERLALERKLGRQILLAQYFNALKDCAAVRAVASDPLIRYIAHKYIGTVPRFLGANLWWTYPVEPNRADQMRHAHFFHRDIDDFRFLKFFFYISDVEAGDGAHWIVPGSHVRPPILRFSDRWLIRRFEDKDIVNFYGSESVREIVGPKGIGFAEDTLCIHKAATPTRRPRLILQLQFGMFNFVPENDERDPALLNKAL